MHEQLIHHLGREEVQAKMTRLEPQESRSDEIAQELSLMVFDQPEACKAVGRRLAMFETNLQDPNRPLGVLYFVGQTGSGKTEMGRAVSNYMFSSPDSDRVRVLNMSEYSEHHYASRLVGSPQGYVGYDEESAIPHDWLHKGRSIVVFDEIEKAHPSIHRTLLSVFDKGKLQSRNGRHGAEELDFTNSLIILTSNVAGKEVSDILKGRSKEIGFGARDVDKSAQANKAVQKGLKDQFPPEFLARLDDVVVFNAIESESTKNAIITKFIGERNSHLRYVLQKKAPYIDLTREARQFLIEHSGDEGGRALKKSLELYIFDRMADVISSVDYSRRPFVADIEDGNTVWYTDEPPIEVIPIVEELPKESGKKNEQPRDPSDGDEDGSDDRANNRRKIGKRRKGPGILSQKGLMALEVGNQNGRTADILLTIKENGEEREQGFVLNIPLGSVS